MKRMHWGVALILLAAFALRLYRLDAQDIWWDEARNIDVAGRPLAQIATAGELDIHPPVYFYLLHSWLRLTGNSAAPSGQDAFAVRFLSLWFGVLFIALMYALGRRVEGFWAGLGAALTAAFLPFLLGEAQEVRMYTVALVWLAAASLAVLRADARGQGSGVRGQSGPISAGQPQNGSWSRGFSRFLPPSTQPAKTSIPDQSGRSRWRLSIPWLLFAVFSALALLTHYAAAFGLVALWGWAGLRALWGGRSGLWPRLRAVVLAGIVTALLCLPGLPVALRQIPTYRNPNLVVPSVKTYLGQLAQVYGLGEHLDPTVAQPWIWALAALLLGGWLVGIAHYVSRITHHAPRNSQSAVHNPQFAILWALLPLIVYYLVILDRSTFATRYIAGALPGWLLLAGLAVAGWARLGRIGGSAAALALVAILMPGLIGDLTDQRFFREDTRGMVAWLQQETKPEHDIILVDQRYPFGLYWPRWNSSAVGTPPTDPANLAPAQYIFVDINTVAQRLSVLARGRERVFLVRWFESDTDPRGAASWVLEKFGARLGQQNFRGYQVTWYVVPPEADFELAPDLTGPPATFGDQVRLEGYAFGGRGPGFTSTVAETRAPEAPADQPVWVVVRWSRLPGAVEPGKALPRGLKATVVLADSEGFVVGSDDRAILNDRHLAPLEWPEADRPLGVYLVRAAPATPPGTYTVKLAVYDPLTLAQLPAIGSATRGTFAVLGQITLTRPTQPADSEQLPIDAPLSLSWQGVLLLGRGPLPTQISPGDRLGFDLFWQASVGNLPDLKARLTLEPLAAAGAAGVDWETPLASGYATAAWQAGDVVRGRQQLQLNRDTQAGDYQLTLRLADAASLAVSPPVTLGQVTLAGRPHVFEPPAGMARRSGARFGNLATLLGYDLAAPSVRMDTLQVTLYWRAESASAAPYAGTVQLLDENGILRAQRDQQPGDAPTIAWITGEILTDTYRIALPADLPTGDYAVIVKLYEAATGAPLPVATSDSTPAGDFLRLATIQIP